MYPRRVLLFLELEKAEQQRKELEETANVAAQKSHDKEFGIQRCQAADCFMPGDPCDGSHKCRGPGCGRIMHGFCGEVDLHNNDDGNEMLRVCGRVDCGAGRISAGDAGTPCLQY